VQLSALRRQHISLRRAESGTKAKVEPLVDQILGLLRSVDPDAKSAC
jgi:hypothetical protein